MPLRTNIWGEWWEEGQLLWELPPRLLFLLQASFIWDPGHFCYHALLESLGWSSGHHRHSRVGPGAGFICQSGRAFR